MVSKITLFEPHFDGAQIGPEAIGTETMAKTADSTDADAATTDSESRLPDPTTRMPRIRTLVVAGVLISAVLSGVLAWRRFRGQDESEDEPAATAVVEERLADAIPTE